KLGWIEDKVARPLHVLNMAVLAPITLALGIWPLNRSLPDWYLSPILMGVLVGASTVLSVWLSPRLTSDRGAAGSLLLLIPMNNISYTLAGFLTLLLLPIAAYPYNAIMMYPYLIATFGVWMPLSYHWRHGEGSSLAKTFMTSVFSAPSMSIVGIGVGTALNAWAPPMPHALVPVLKFMVFASTTITMFAIGARLHFRRLTGYTSLLVWLCAIKFIVHPLAMIAICWVFGVHGMLAATLFIASCMPAGVYGPAIATINDLDIDLANAGYMWSTGIFMLVGLPLMIWALKLPIFQ
ncbi:hypothetical protein LLG95_06500, partial [bacterium]|nr:hypothetical protein [bacterium]